MYTFLKRLVLIILAIAVVITGATLIFLQQPVFGSAASGDRLAHMQVSKNFKEGEFVNRAPTELMTGDKSTLERIYTFLFSSTPRVQPESPLPSKKIDLKALKPDEDVLVWFGHSSYFIQVDGKKVLVDPVLSGAAAPVDFMINAFEGTDIYKPSDIPDLDYVFISHDHYDHLDYKTMVELRPRIGKVICGLGVGAHLEEWGFKPDQIIEQDWQDQVTLGDGFVAHTMPARHFSGRTFSQNTTLWASYVLVTPTLKLYFGGDSGYDKHFAEIGQLFNGIDLALLENGQYNEEWRNIHTMPDELPLAARDLKAKRVIAGHSSKFVLARHPWDEPLILANQKAQAGKLPLITPMIGEPVFLNDTTQKFTVWWQGIN